MKSFVAVALLVVFAFVGTSALQCQTKPADITKEWITMDRTCLGEMQRQIKMEVAASTQYLAMAAHFSRDSVHRPGFAKLFFEAASEEREHAMKLLEYLLMRGELTSGLSGLITISSPERDSWANGVEALEFAVSMESNVTKSIREVIKRCEDDVRFNDYHLVDYLTGDFLEEQYHGQRDLAGKASTLKKMLDKHQALGEFLFDKKLLNAQVA